MSSQAPELIRAIREPWRGRIISPLHCSPVTP